MVLTKTALLKNVKLFTIPYHWSKSKYGSSAHHAFQAIWLDHSNSILLSKIACHHCHVTTTWVYLACSTVMMFAVMFLPNESCRPNWNLKVLALPIHLLVIFSCFSRKCWVQGTAHCCLSSIITVLAERPCDCFYEMFWRPVVQNKIPSHISEDHARVQCVCSHSRT